MKEKTLEHILKNLESIGNWSIEGVPEKEIARRLGVSDRTLRRYKKANLSVKDSLNAGKKNRCDEVEYALLKKALGYKYKEEQPQKVKKIYYDENGNKCIEETIQIIQIEKVVPPDVQAQKFWLNNRKKTYWKDNPHKVKTDAELLDLRKKELESKTW